MNRDILIQATHLGWRAGLPIFWHSTSGLGKTSSAAALAKLLNAHFELLVGTCRLPEDIAGYPLPETTDGKTFIRRLPDTWVRRVKEALAEKLNVVLFLDDFTTCSEAMETAFYRVVQERVAGDEDISGVWLLAATNPPGIAAGGRQLSRAIANRFCHFKLEYDPGDWATRKRQGFRLPELYTVPSDWENLLPKWDSVVGAFCRSLSPQLRQLHTKAGNDPGGEILGYPSERSPDNLGRALAVVDAALPKDADSSKREELIHAFAEGLIGEQAAHLFFTWLKEQDIPNPEDLLLKASKDETFELPKRGDSMHIALSGVVQAVIDRENTPERWLSALKVFDKAPADIAAAMFSELYAAKPQGITLSKTLMDLVARYSVLSTGSKGLSGKGGKKA